MTIVMTVDERIARIMAESKATFDDGASWSVWTAAYDAAVQADGRKDIPYRTEHYWSVADAARLAYLGMVPVTGDDRLEAKQATQNNINQSILEVHR